MPLARATNETMVQLEDDCEEADRISSERVMIQTAVLNAFVQAERDFAGAASEAGFVSEDDMQEYMLTIRKEVRGY